MNPPPEVLTAERLLTACRGEVRSIPVTVCVAAICNASVLFGAADRMLTAADIQFEPELPKIFNITNSSVLMMAGESSLQNEIYLGLFAYVAEELRNKPNDWIPIGALAEEYHRIYQRIKSKRAESRLLGPLGLTMDTFIQRQKQMSDSIVELMTKEILNFDMPGIEAIITGIDSDGPPYLPSYQHGD